MREVILLPETIEARKSSVLSVLRERLNATSRIKRDFYVVLMKDYSRATTHEEKRNILGMMRKLEKGSKLIVDRKDEQLIKNIIRDETELAKKVISYLGRISIELKEFKKLLDDTEMALPHFVEKNGFLWTNGVNDNFDLLKNMKIPLTDDSFVKLEATLQNLFNYVPVDSNSHKITEAIDSLKKILLYITNLRKKIIEEHKRQDSNYLSSPDIGVSLNSSFKVFTQWARVLKEIIDIYIKEIDEAIRNEKDSLDKHMINHSNVTLSSALKDYHFDQSKGRILMLTHEFRREGGGGIQSVTQMLTKYLKKEYNVDVIERSIESSDDGVFRYFPNSVHTPALKFRDMTTFFNELSGYPLSVVHVQSINFGSGPNGWYNGGLDEIKNQYKKIPVICTVHSVVRFEKELKGNLNWIDFSIRLQDETLKLSNKVIVLHKFGYDQIRKFYPYISESNLHIIPNGIELTSHFFENLAHVEKNFERVFSKNPTLLYVGRISTEKGLTELVESMKRIKKDFNARLVIVGSNSSSAYYYRLISDMKRLGLEKDKDIIFAGAIPQSEHLDKVYMKYLPDLAVLPSHHESFPLFALEAISHGVPLLVTDSSGPREIYSPFRVTKSGDGVRDKQSSDIIREHSDEEIINPAPGINIPLAIGVDPHNPISIYDATKWCLENPGKTHTILKNAMRALKLKYSWDAIADETSKLYKAMLNGRSFVSSFQEEEIDEDLFIINHEQKKKLKVGLLGHFKYSNGVVPDGVARWNEGMFSYLRSRGYDVEGYGFVGSPRTNEGVVHFAPAKIFDEMVEKSDIDVAIFRGDIKWADKSLLVLRNRGIKSIYVIPYFGVWQGAYDIANKCDILITGTRDYAQKLRSKTGKDCRYIPWPIDTKFWKRSDSDYVKSLKPSSWPKDTFNLVYVGRMGIMKKMHNVISNFNDYIIKKGHSNFRLILCGLAEDDMGNKIRSEIDKHKLSDYVVYIEREFTSEEVRKIYCSSDVFLFASSFETYGQSNLEAISCETPTVAPMPAGFSDYSVPSMVNLPGYEFGFKSGDIYLNGDLNPNGTPFDWDDCFNKVIWIYNNYDKAKQIMKKWSDYIDKNMSKEVVGRMIEKAIADVSKDL